MNLDTFFSALMTIGGFMMIGVNVIQIYHLIKVKDSKGLSVGAYLTVCSGLTCMGSYGIYHGILELYIPIFIQVIMVLFIIFLIFKYRKEENGGVMVITHSSTMENTIPSVDDTTIPSVEGTMIEICISPEPRQIILDD